MRAVIVLLCACSLVAAERRYSSSGNTTLIGLPDGRVEFEWLTAASFRLACDWGPARAIVPSSKDRVDYRVNEQPGSLIFESKYLAVEIALPELKVEVRTREGKVLASDAAGPARGAGKIVLDRTLAENERVYGLGEGGENSLDVRGRRITTAAPFFFTTAGYGVGFASGAKYLFDIGATSPSRMRITEQGAARFEYRFYYGPTPKEIFEMRGALLGGAAAARLDGGNLCDAIRRLNVASLSGSLDAAPAIARPELRTFLRVYDREREDRAYPVVRPLVMQFSTAVDAHRMTNLAMLGDELLLAPKCAGEFPLPKGIWTDVDTDRVYRGRELFAAKAELALLARNGSIVPLDKGDVLELHYFPKLGAEFFIYEPEVADYTQLHAAPATDYWRLEIESKVRRKYEWVLHHTQRGTLRVRVDAEPGGDDIVNIPFGAASGQ